MKSNSMNDIFSWTARWAELPEQRRRPLNLWQATETGSTNSVAKDDENIDVRHGLPNEGDLISPPTLYIAREQSQGRGRGDHSWTAPAGQTLLSSWSFGMRRVPQPILSPLAGLALFQTVRETWPRLAFNLKAPNDLYIGRLKVAGLLIETVEQGEERRTIVGLGLNALGHPESISTSTCLKDELRKINEPELSEDGWHSFLSSFLKHLEIAMRDGQTSVMTSTTSNLLSEALNKHPLLAEPIERVDSLGQLHFKNRIVHWHEL